MPAPHPSQPPEAFDHQDEVFAPAFAVLQEAIQRRSFPAASVAITHGGKLVALKALGTLTYDEGAPSFSRPLRDGGDSDLESTTPKSGAPFLASLARSGQGAVTPSTLFDLASLTKVVATTPAAMLLY